MPKFTEIAIGHNNQAIPAVRPGTGHPPLTVGSAATATGAFGSETALIRVVGTQPMWIDIGSSPSATSASGTYLPAGIPEYFLCSPGDSLAAVNSSTAGACYVKEC